MGIFSGMTDKTAPRGFRWIWYIRIAQFIITLLVIALAAVNAYQWRDFKVPEKIAWNIACVCQNPIVMILTCLPLTIPLGGYLLSCSNLFRSRHRSREDIQIIAVAGMGTGHPGCASVHLLDRRGRNFEIDLQRLLQGILGLACGLEWYALLL